MKETNITSQELPEQDGTTHKVAVDLVVMTDEKRGDSNLSPTTVLMRDKSDLEESQVNASQENVAESNDAIEETPETTDLSIKEKEKDTIENSAADEPSNVSSEEKGSQQQLTEEIAEDKEVLLEDKADIVSLDNQNEEQSQVTFEGGEEKGSVPTESEEIKEISDDIVDNIATADEKLEAIFKQEEIEDTKNEIKEKENSFHEESMTEEQGLEIIFAEMVPVSSPKNYDEDDDSYESDESDRLEFEKVEASRTPRAQLAVQEALFPNIDPGEIADGMVGEESAIEEAKEPVVVVVETEIQESSVTKEIVPTEAVSEEAATTELSIEVNHETEETITTEVEAEDSDAIEASTKESEERQSNLSEILSEESVAEETTVEENGTEDPSSMQKVVSEHLSTKEEIVTSSNELVVESGAEEAHYIERVASGGPVIEEPIFLEEEAEEVEVTVKTGTEEPSISGDIMETLKEEGVEKDAQLANVTGAETVSEEAVVITDEAQEVNITQEVVTEEITTEINNISEDDGQDETTGLPVEDPLVTDDKSLNPSNTHEVEDEKSVTEEATCEPTEGQVCKSQDPSISADDFEKAEAKDDPSKEKLEEEGHKAQACSSNEVVTSHSGCLVVVDDGSQVDHTSEEEVENEESETEEAVPASSIEVDLVEESTTEGVEDETQTVSTNEELSKEINTYQEEMEDVSSPGKTICEERSPGDNEALVVATGPSEVEKPESVANETATSVTVEEAIKEEEEIEGNDSADRVVVKVKDLVTEGIVTKDAVAVKKILKDLKRKQFITDSLFVNANMTEQEQLPGLTKCDILSPRSDLRVAKAEEEEALRAMDNARMEVSLNFNPLILFYLWLSHEIVIDGNRQPEQRQQLITQSLW